MTEHGDFNAEFKKMMGGLEEEQHDPVATALLGSAIASEAKLAKTLREAGEVPDELQDKIIRDLNDRSDKAKILDNNVIVTGKVRSQIDFSSLGEEFLPACVKDLGKLLHDERGPYYDVLQHTFTCDIFDIDTVQINPDDPDSDAYELRVMMYLNSAMDDADPGDDGVLYVYPSELEAFVPEEPSSLKIKQEITKRYPKIARQLDTLPVDCGNDKAIVAALRDLQVEIDWRDYPRHSEDERERLVDNIERYVTDRLKFDTAQYGLEVRGNKADIDNQDAPSTENTRISGYIGGVKLLREHEGEGETPADEDITRYRFMLGVLVLSGERGSYEHSFQTIPVDFIKDIVNTRDGGQFNVPIGTSAHTPSEASPVATEPEEATEVHEAEDANTTELAAVKTGEHIAISGREQELAALDKLLSELFTSVSLITNKLYDTEDEAIKASHEISNIIQTFNELYPTDKPPVIEAAGPGVYSLNVELDRENSMLEPGGEDGAVMLRFTGVELKKSDILTVKRGTYLLHALARAGASTIEEGKYGVAASLLFSDSESMQPIRFGSLDRDSLSLFSLLPAGVLMASVDIDETKLPIPEYDQLRACRIAIAKISDKCPDLIELPGQLSELKNKIDNSDPAKYMDFEDLGLIHAIGNSVGGDEEASQHTVDALMQILGNRSIKVIAEMYDGDGNPVGSQYIEGRVEEVISTHTKIPTAEPMLALRAAGEMWYVPLTTITRFRY